MDQKTTKSPHPPVNLRIKFRSDSLPQFIERYATDVSRGGIFIRTREPLGVGTQLKLDFQYQAGVPLMSGDGTVVWVREFDPSRANVPPGMGVRFDKLAPESLVVLEQILAAKAEREGGATAATSTGPARPLPADNLPGGGRRPGLGSAPQAAASPQAAVAAPPVSPATTDAFPARAPAPAQAPAAARGTATATPPAPPVPLVTPVSGTLPESGRRTARSTVFPESPSFVDSDELDEEPTQIAAGLPSLMGGGTESEEGASASTPRLPGMAASRLAGTDAEPSLPPGERSPADAGPAAARASDPTAPVRPPATSLPAPAPASVTATAQIFTSALRSTGPAGHPSSVAVPRAVTQPERSEESTTESTVPGPGELGAARGEGGEAAPRGGLDDDSSANFSAATTTTPLDPADLVETTASSSATPGHEEPVQAAAMRPELRGAPEPRGAAGAGEPTLSLSLDGLHPEPSLEPRAPSAIAAEADPKAGATPGAARAVGADLPSPGATRDRDVEVPAPPSAAHARERRLPAPLILVTVLVLAASSFFLVRFFKSQSTDLVPGTEPGHTAVESPGASPPTLRAAEPAGTGEPARSPAAAPTPTPTPTAGAEPAAGGAAAALGTGDASGGTAVAVPAATPPTGAKGAPAAGEVAAAPSATEIAPAAEAPRPGEAPPDGKTKSESGKTDPAVEASHPRDSKPEKVAAPKRKPIRLARASAGSAGAGNGDGESESTGGAASKAGGGTVYELKITSKPPGGDVSIDGQVVGKTPFTGNVGDLGSPHFVTIRRDGFELFEQMVGTTSAWVKVKAGKPGAGSSVQQLKLNVKLRPLAGTPIEPPAEASDRPAGEAAPKLDKTDKVDKADDNTLPPTDLVAPGGAQQ